MHQFLYSLINSLNFEQTGNSEYEQYLTENDRNYVTYGRNSVDEEDESDFVHDDVTYGKDTIQDSFSPCKLFSYFSSVLNTES